MDDPLCRVTIQCADTPRAVDLALPRYARLGVLFPDIVELAAGGGSSAAGWRLDRLAGGRWDESLSLHDSGIRDGDVIVLSAVSAPAPGPLSEDVFVAGSDTEPGAATTAASVGGWTAAGGIVALGLALSGPAGADHLVVAATAAVAACGYLAVGLRRERRPAMAMSLVFFCTAAFLVTPGPPGPAHLLLTAAVGVCASVVALRFTGSDAPLFTATATGATLMAVASAVTLALSADLAALGAVLAVLSLGVLSGSGRLALGLSGLRPARAVPQPRLAAAGDRLAGLVGGCAVTAAGAAACVAAGCLRADVPWPPAAALAGALAGVLALRARVFADARCRRILYWSGMTCAAVTLGLSVWAVPTHTGWPAVAALGVAAWCRGRGAAAGPMLTRGVDAVEYLLCAAVIPLACWAGGGYDLVRSARLM